MVDDIFRGRAVLDDKMSPALRTIQQEWARFNKGMQLGSARREVDGLRGSLRNIGSEITSFTLPALSRFGMAGGGVVAAVVGIGAAVKSYSEKIQDLGIASKELGISARNIRAFELAAGSVRINPSQALQGLETFKKNAEDFQLKIGGLRDELRSYGAGDVVEAMRKAKEPIDQMRIAFARMEELQKRNPALARRFAQEMFGSAVFARMSWNEFRQSFEKVNDLTADEIRRAERLNKQFLELGTSVEKLKQSATGVLLPGVSATMGEVNKLIGALTKAEEWVRSKTGTTGGEDLMGDLATKMLTGKGVDVGGDPMGNDYARGMKSGPTSDQLQLRLPRMLDPRRKEDTQEGVKKGVEDGLESFFQKHSSNQSGAGGFMNASLGGIGGGGRMGPGIGGQWGNRDFPNLGGSGGGGSNPAAGGTVPKSYDGKEMPGSPLDLTGSPKVGGEFMKGRERFAKELEQNPALKEKLFGIVMGENKDDKAGRSVMESAMNRAVVRGTSLAAQLKLHAQSGINEGGYYAGYRPGDVNRYRKRLEGQLKDVLAGSNVSDYATDNASSWLAEKHKRTGTFGFRKEYGKESFFGPDSRIRSQHERWKKMVGEAEAGSNVAAKEQKARDMSGVVGNAEGRSFNDMWSDRIDNAIKPQNMSATGTVNLNVTAPSGTKVDSKTEGLFQSTSIKRIKQMEPSEYGTSE